MFQFSILPPSKIIAGKVGCGISEIQFTIETEQHWYKRLLLLVASNTFSANMPLTMKIMSSGSITYFQHKSTKLVRETF